MRTRPPFTFAVPLVGRAAVADFARVEALLASTLRSALAQTDPDLRVLIMGHDRPRGLPDDPRVSFHVAGWPSGAADGANNDAGRKKHALARLAAARGPGLLMPLDADDWVSRDLVATARREIGPGRLGGVVTRGSILDLATRRIAPLPLPGGFEQPFYALCGSSVVARIDPSHPDPLRRDPLSILRDHHCWPQAARARGASVAELSASACYVVGTRENHSERHGPFAEWRRRLNEQVRRVGRPADPALLAQFGQDPAALEALAARRAA